MVKKKKKKKSWPLLNIQISRHTVLWEYGEVAETSTPQKSRISPERLKDFLCQLLFGHFDQHTE